MAIFGEGVKEHSLYPRECSVGLSQILLVFEVLHHTHSTEHEGSSALACGVDGEACVINDFNARFVAENAFYPSYAFLGGGEGFFAEVDTYSYYYLVEEG